MTTPAIAPHTEAIDLDAVCARLEATLSGSADDVRDVAAREKLLSAAQLAGSGARVGSPIELSDLIRATQEAAAAFSLHGLEQPGQVIARIGEALSRIEQQGQLVDDVVQLVPRELCEAGEFDAVVVSQIVGSSWVPQASFAAALSASEGLARLADPEPHPLVSGGAEAEAVRRRLPALVTPADGGVSRPYVVAPVVVGEVVIGLVHAEVLPQRRMLSELDRAAVRAFTDGLGVIVERLVLQRRLASQSRRLNEALLAAARSVADIESRPDWVFSPPAQAKRSSRTESTPNDGLTTRERDVLRLLVSGATNGQIADRLTVSETTVKSHVRHILHKLRVTNRAEAIAKYLASRPGAEPR